MIENSKKQNCWEYCKCGREPGGINANESGICPASTNFSSDGKNGGKNGGRICWTISGTFCGEKIRGSYAKTQISCKSCAFFKKVRQEEGEHFFKCIAPTNRRDVLGLMQFINRTIHELELRIG